MPATSDTIFPMMNYTFSTPESSYVFVQHPTVSENVFVFAHRPSDLETVLDSLELSGMADDNRLEDLIIEEDPINDTKDKDDNFCNFFLELTKSDLAVFLSFEVQNFLGVVADD